MPMPRRETHTDCLERMFALRRFGIKLGLATIRRMLAGLGNPHRLYPCIHVAGTNGKGSVASNLAEILIRSGYRVGLYTSPHLVRFNERIKIDGAEITDADIVRLYRRVKRALPAGREPTFFEFTTAMALDEFGRREVDWAVIETGMGGRLDATNVLSPELSIITNISLEHREYLGRTLREIAFEKAGIIKRRRPVVTAARQAAALGVIAQTAQAKSAPLYRLGPEFRVRRTKDGRFTYYGMNHVWPEMATSLQGGYQVENAAMALAACELLMKRTPRLSLQSMRAGLLANHWPGRLELVCRKPLVMFDGAHNLAAARQLARHLAANFQDRAITMVIGILDDKPYQAMLNLLLPRASRLIVTRAKITRALPPETIEAVARPLVSDIRIVPDVGRALRYAMETAAPESLILVAGSLYVVGEAKAALEGAAVQPG
jgi:dihydrofolate synthase / folylpolyglutamate synthase